VYPNLKKERRRKKNQRVGEGEERKLAPGKKQLFSDVQQRI